MPERPLFWHFPAYLQAGGHSEGVESRDPLFRSRPCSIVRLGDWKLHQYFEDGGLELYHLSQDIGETTNLAKKYPHVKDDVKVALSVLVDAPALGVVVPGGAGTRRSRPRPGPERPTRPSGPHRW